VINGKWQIDSRLGSGGMATVYAATHRNGHRAALKMLHSALSRDAPTRARFLREGYVANAVAHPGVVGVLDDGVTEDGAVFLVLELLEGETIDERRVRLGGTLPIDEALDLADQALDALAAAHEKGIVHRDVKPENVFVTKEGRVKLLDFGLARMKNAPSAETTKTGITIGTPEFMPPEQALGRRGEPDARSDVWGFGATLFTMITGRHVHDDAQSLHEQLVASATRRSRPIRQVAGHVPAAVASVVDRALELEMSDRWPGAREMQIALRAARSHVDPGSLARSPDSWSDQTMRMRDAPPKYEGGRVVPRTLARVQHSELGAPRASRPSCAEHTTRPPEGRSASHPPQQAALPFRQPIDTPSAEHVTTPARVVPPAPTRASSPTLRLAFGQRHAGDIAAVSGPPPPHAPAEPPRAPRSSRAILYVAVVLFAVCAAMGAYVLSHGAAPR
jgi:serine/threonine-protein kinase